MRLIQFIIAFVFLGISLHAGVMPEEAPRSVVETIISFNDQQIDYSSDIVEPTISLKEQVEDFLHFTFMTLLMFI